MLLIDIEKQEITFSKEELTFEGASLALDHFMGIPLLDAEIGGESYRMFFDTGAQVSYFQHRSLKSFPPVGSLTDFYPGYGEFVTETHQVEVCLGGQMMTLRCGWFAKNVGRGTYDGRSEGNHR